MFLCPLAEGNKKEPSPTEIKYQGIFINHSFNIYTAGDIYVIGETHNKTYGDA